MIALVYPVVRVWIADVGNRPRTGRTRLEREMIEVTVAHQADEVVDRLEHVPEFFVRECDR